MSLTIGSLFAGIGGFDLAGEAMGWRTSWFVEWDASCRFWLAEHFPGRPIYGDITQVDFTEVEPVDILTGGFPCQPSSAAGKRLGTADDRWLWPEFARAIRQIRPRYVVAENVPGLVSVNGGRAFAEVLRDLAALGYDAEWDRLSAGDVGSPQERERIFVVAYDNRDGFTRVAQLDGEQNKAWGAEAPRRRHVDGCNGQMGESESIGQQRSGNARRRWAGLADDGPTVGDTNKSSTDARTEAGGPRRAVRERGSCVGNADGGRLSERAQLDGGASQDSADRDSCGGHAHGSRLEVRAWRDGQVIRGADGTVRLIPREAAEQGPESPLWPVAARLPGSVARLRAIGNTVVPQCVVEGPFRVIMELERQREAA